MPLMMRFRRWWALVALVLLLLPAAGLVLPDVTARRTVEAPARHWWMNAGRRLDPFIESAFGFRGAVLLAHNAYRMWLGSAGNDNVFVGSDDSLYFKGNAAFAQSLGELVRRPEVQAFVKRMVGLDRLMRERGGRLLVIVPPNSQTIRQDGLPAQARHRSPPRTEYDLAARRLAARGVTFVDLRAALRAAGGGELVYRRNDSHWNTYGALVGFNATMAGAGLPELAMPPDSVLAAPTERWDGDLVRSLGLPFAWRPDLDREPLEPAAEGVPIDGIFHGPETPGLQARWAVDYGRAGPRIMMVGDSFVAIRWRPFISRVAGAAAFMNHERCQFDAGAIDRFAPDILIYEATERLFPCQP